MTKVALAVAMVLAARQAEADAERQVSICIWKYRQLIISRELLCQNIGR